MRAGLFIAFQLLMAAPLAAAPSLCGHLPEAGPVAAAAPETAVPPIPRADRTLLCPPGTRLDMAARPPACRRPGQRAAEGNPRAACRASLALGPIAALPTQWRPTRSCPGGAITALIRLEGANAGLADVAVKPLSPGISVRVLDEDAAAPAERPSARGCFAHTCRLLTLTVAADATDPARLEVAIADGPRLVVPVPLTTHCPDAAARAALLTQP